MRGTEMKADYDGHMDLGRVDVVQAACHLVHDALARLLVQGAHTANGYICTRMGKGRHIVHTTRMVHIVSTTSKPTPWHGVAMLGMN